MQFTVTSVCPRCEGTGQYYNYGVCFRCHGTGEFTKTTKTDPTKLAERRAQARAKRDKKSAAHAASYAARRIESVEKYGERCEHATDLNADTRKRCKAYPMVAEEVRNLLVDIEAGTITRNTHPHIFRNLFGK